MGSCAFIIMAAGSGSRLGGEPKQLRILGGKPVWKWTFDLACYLYRENKIQEIVVTIPKDGDPSLFELKSLRGNPPFKIVRGGASRSMSVREALKASVSDMVLIHDGARPFLSPKICLSVMEKVDRDLGVIPVVSINDALKSIDGEGFIHSVDRTPLRLTQTPQGFYRKTLLKILEPLPEEQPDEAAPWLSCGKSIITVDGDRMNFKITDEDDWRMAKSLVPEEEPVIRTGFGYDIHPLVPNRPLILGGVKIASDLGLDGHSDADLICHSVSDALLGAAGLPDIGRRYPATDDKYKDIDSAFLLSNVVDDLGKKGWIIDWVDIVLNSQYPRIGETVEIIIDSLESILGDGIKQHVNLKVKSGEMVPPVGNAECMTCYCVATIRKNIKGLA